MYKFSKDLLPDIFEDYFICNNKVNSYRTRNSESLYIPFYRLSLSRNSIRYTGPNIWNSITPSLKLCPTLSSFKRQFKLQFLNAYCE